MLTFQISEILPLEKDCCDKFEGIAYDGCFFYLTSPKCCQIYKYDKCFHCKACFTVCRSYTSICYDEYCKCFWAIIDNSCNKIFKLDLYFNEIDCICVKQEETALVQITGISCDYSKTRLLICYDNCIATVEKKGTPTPCIIQKSTACTQFTGVQNLHDYYLASSANNGCESISAYSQCSGLALQCCLPSEYVVEDMSTVRVKNCSSKAFPIIYILVSKCCTSYLMKCSLTSYEETPHGRDCNCNYSCQHGDACCDDCDESCDCDYYDEFNCSFCPNPGDCHQSCNNIIESIALIETALSHILNAEGEKIQKILCTSDKPCEIMTVNESVNKTIMNITHLEHILFSKLQLIKELCPERCKCNSQE